MMPLSRRSLGLGLVGVAATAAVGGPAFAQATAPKGGVIRVATIGEPGPLDPTATTADLLSIITQHMFETLYTFDAQWQIRPLLADGMPQVSADSKQYRIKLRQGVKFQDGSPMTGDDVVASLKRWTRISPRGKLAAPYIQNVAMQDGVLAIDLNKPFAPLLALLAMNNAAAAIIPAKLAGAAILTSFIGTGPYKLLEHKPDQYIRLVRFDEYSSPPGTPSGYAGARKAIIGEVRFIPVPNSTTRVDGILAAQYDFADSLPAEMDARFKGHADVAPIIVKPFGFPLMIFNQKAGVMTSMQVRQAAQAALSCSDMLAGGFGNPDFFKVEGSIYPKGTRYYDESSVKGYNQNDPAKAKAMLKQAGYKGQPIRIMTSQQYDFLYKMSLVAQQNLQDAGFNVDLQVLDWATLLQHRGNPADWDAFFTYHTFVPEPSLITIMDPAYPGWWNTPQKQAALAAFDTDTQDAKRVEDWHHIQALFYQQVPAIKVGDFYNLAARLKKVHNYTVTPWPFFWNVSLQA
jgi:peptide/nickel transport system substrate-binding protein